MDIHLLDQIDEETAIDHIRALLVAVSEDEDGLVIARDGRPVAALIPADLYNELAEDRDNRIWQSLRRRDPGHVRPVTRAVESIRSVSSPD